MPPRVFPVGTMALVLTACGGGGSGADIVPPPAIDLADFFIGSKGDTASNGVGFATEATPVSALGSRTVQAPLIFATHNPISGEHALQLLGLLATVPSDPTLSGFDDVFVLLDELEFDFVDGFASTATGESAVVTFAGDGRYVSTYEVFGTFAGNTSYSGFGVVGFQTDPIGVAGLTERVLYLGAYQGQGTFTLEDSVAAALVPLNGSARVDVDFTTGNVSGALETSDLLALSGGVPTSASTTFTFADTLSGNGFVADLSMECSNGFLCDGGGRVGGALFGPNAEEVAGISAMSGTITAVSEPSSSVDFEAAGVFNAVSTSE